MPKVRCPQCSATLNIPETAAGKMGKCSKCSGVFRVPSLKPPTSPPSPQVKKPKPSFFYSVGRQTALLIGSIGRLFRSRPGSLRVACSPASTPVERPLENSKVRLLEKLPIAVRIGDEVVTVDRQDDGTLGSECNSVSVNEFLRFYLELDVGPQIMLAASENLGDAEGLKTLAESFVAWLGLNEPRGEDGRLKKAVTCIGYRDPDEAQGRFVLQRCAQRTRNVTGLCRFHDDPHSYTLWNCDPQEVNPLLEKALNEKMEWVNAERVRRESKWKRVASRITYTATDRQIYLLLDLGEEPAYLEGIDNRAASILIGVMLEEAGSVRFDEKPDPGYYF